MPLPGTHTLNTEHLTGYTPSCGASPVAAYMRAPFRGRILKFTGILGGAITTADGTVTVTNITKGTAIGTFTITQAGSAAGQLQSAAPSTVAVSYVDEDDVLAFTPSGAGGANVPLHISAAIRSQ